MSAQKTPENVEDLSLSKSAEYLIEECRMVLPGVQALFGFKLIAVFSERFDKALSQVEKDLHLAAIAFVMGAIALIMAPAAYHRLTSPCRVTDRFLWVCTRLLMAGLPLLLVGLCLDFYLIARVMTGNPAAGILAGVAFAVFATLWFVLPLASRALRRDPAAR